MNKKAFTLVELLVVVAIIGILSTVIVISVQGAQSKARDSKRRNDLQIIAKAINLYYVENETQISTDGYIATQDYGAGSNERLAETLIPKYLGSLPCDPKNKSCPPSSIVGYNHVRKDWRGHCFSSFPIPHAEFNKEHYSLYAKLENPSQSDRDSFVDDYDKAFRDSTSTTECILGTSSQGSHFSSGKANYRVGN